MPDIVNYVDVVSPRQAAGPVADVYGQAKREIGRLVEAVTMFSPDPSLLVANWAAFREPLLANGFASRASKEAVAATVTRVLKVRRPPRRVSVGKAGERIGIVAKRLLPYRVFERAAKSSLGV